MNTHQAALVQKIITNKCLKISGLSASAWAVMAALSITWTVSGQVYAQVKTQLQTPSQTTASKSSGDLFDLPSIEPIVNYQPKLHLEVLTSDGLRIGRFGEQIRTYVPISQTPKMLQDAILAIEDSRFYSHSGVDPKGMARAVVSILSGGRMQGASTITQQMVRNILLSHERTAQRKAKEIALSLQVEQALSKQRIFEIYLNEIFLGHRSYGFAAAAQTYFGKSLSQLTIAETALLAGIPQNPSYANPLTNLAKAVARQHLVLDRMQSIGVITPTQLAQARAEKIVLQNTESAEQLNIAPHVAELARKTAVDRLGEAALTSGVRIVTAIDSQQQLAAQNAVAKGLKDWSTRNAKSIDTPEAALVALDPQTGRVRALVGSADFTKQPLNHVTQAWRQPGSAFKPFLYSSALERGVMPASLILDAPYTAPNGWSPGNSNGQYAGMIPLHLALAKSSNVASVRVLEHVGLPWALDWVAKFGFEPAKQPNNLTLALGTGTVTPMQMAVGYAALANSGHRIEPVLIEKIIDGKGKILFEAAQPKPPAATSRIITPRNAWLMGQMLNEVTLSGTAAKAQSQLKRSDVYGKTGTTDNAADVWFAGYQERLAAVVWLGHSTTKSIGASESGGRAALPIWIDFMSSALKNIPPTTPKAAPADLSPIQTADGQQWVYSEWMPDFWVQQIPVTPIEAQVSPVLNSN